MSKDFYDRRKEYIENHKKRYEYCVKEITKIISGGEKVMDLGSKFLYQASELSEKGIDVWAYDTSYITSMKEVQRIADENGVSLKSIGSLEDGQIAEGERENTFDALIMTEVIEHLAFNPLPMWKEIFRVLKPKSYIFISTPNSLNMKRMVVQIGRILAGIGVGITVEGIIDTPTYGHHWKEYSIHEIYEYFGKIGIPEERINIKTYSYRSYHKRDGMRYKIENVLRRVGNKTHRFADEIFAIVRMPDPKPSVPTPPSYA